MSRDPLPRDFRDAGSTIGVRDTLIELGRRHPSVTVAAGCAIAAACVAAAAQLLVDLTGIRSDGVDLALQAAVGAGAAVSIFVAGSRSTLGQRRSLWLIGTGVASWALGSAWWLARERAGHPGVPPASAVLYLALAPLVVAAALVYRGTPRRRLAPSELLDALLVVSSFTLILWVLVLRVATERSTGTAPGHIPDIAYVTGDALLIVMLMYLAARTEPEARRGNVVLLGGLFMMALVDLTWLGLGGQGLHSATRGTLTAGWVFGLSMVTAAGWMLRSGSEPPHRVTVGSTDSVLSSLRAVLVGTALLVGVLDVSVRLSRMQYTVALLVLVSALLLGRQALSVQKGRLLADRLAESVRELSEEATHDRLTGLHNRAHLTERIAARSGGSEQSSATMFIDIDHLKTVNDSLGHEVGDLLIETTARRLLEHLDAGSLTRFGGDEFVARILGANSAAVLDTAESVVRACSQPIGEAGGAKVGLRPSVSAGLALDDLDVAPAELLRRADTALYRAKTRGRSRVVVWDPTFDAVSVRRTVIEPELSRALQRGEFLVHYQPVKSLSSGRLIGAEALVRWMHPTEGVLSPRDFLVDADAIGLLEDIGALVLQTATADFAELNSHSDQPLVVAVNMSGSELETPDSVERVDRALGRSALEPSRLTIEITAEGVADDSVRLNVEQIRRLGVEIAVDGFGCGGCSLHQLGGYPASQLKIERSLVEGLGRNPSDAYAVRALVNLARNLGMITVAAGVQSEEQSGVLRRLGCDAAQGWFFGRPVPIDEFRRHVSRGADIVLK